jgi:hypothetical protein
MRLNPEFRDAAEPAGLESWVIIGKVTGQPVKNHPLTNSRSAPYLGEVEEWYFVRRVDGVWSSA